MKKILVIALTALALTAACGDFATTDPTTGNTSGSVQYCPDAADAIAIAQGLPVPYPANPANPTGYYPALPPPVYFHPCLSSAGAQTYRGGVPCMVCTDGTDYYADLLQEQFVCANMMSDGTPVVCVGPLRGGDVTECNPASQGCQ